MNIESLSEARAIAREFHAIRNIVEWNAMFPHMQVKEVIDGLRDLAICCRTSDLERWFTKPHKLKASKSPCAAKLRDLLPRVENMANCLSLLR